MSDLLTERPYDGVALLRLSRPQARNALSNSLVRAIGDRLHELASEVHAIVIAGDARVFAAGADIRELASPGPDLSAWERIRDVAIPTIAAVRGLALGGGLELAMSCDLFVVADDARLGQPETQLGVMPGAGGTQRLTRAVGKTLAMEMVLLGREISGRDAYARGLANASVSSERVETTALAFARRIAASAPVAMRAAKRAVLDAFEMPLAAGLAAERDAFATLLGTDDAREGIAAFLDKRRPNWSNR
jgi:enoyl-CoA hydratase